MMLMYGFWGIVEDRDDPSQLGRVRVRMIGLHTNDKSEGGIPTESLMWAYPMMPITSASVNGIGQTPLGVVPGSWVFGFFRDGEASQDPVVMGTIPGIPREVANTDVGFSDPEGVYPKIDYINEPDLNRLARNEWVDPNDHQTHPTKIEETIVKSKTDSVDKNVPDALGDKWSEPKTPYAAKYPHNHVRESECGHIEEWDDTPGVERTHRYHTSGTFEEIYPDGTKVTRIVGDQYEILYGDDFLHVKGEVNITIDGNAKIYTKGTVHEKIDGDYIQHIKGDFLSTIDGKSHQIIGKTYDRHSVGDSRESGANMYLNS